MTTVMLIAGGATSTGGLTAFAVKKLFWKAERKHQTNETGGEQNENRDNGTENRRERNESLQNRVER
jgi:ribulose kinase